MKKLSSLLLCLVLIISCVLSFGCDGKEVDKSQYKIECELMDNQIVGKEEVIFYNDTENSFTNLKFNLYANAFREDAKYKPIAEQYSQKAYYNGKSYGDITISKVYDEKGELEYKIAGEDKNILDVSLNGEVFPDECVKIYIEYTIKLAEVVARTGVNKNTINLANFYPIICGTNNGAFYECVYYSNGDPYFSDCADYEVTITLDSEFIVASSGELKEHTLKNDKQTNTYVLDNARSFAFVVSKNFESATLDVNGVEINYYFCNDEFPKKALETAKKSLEFFTATFGEYPYKKYSVVQTEFTQGGMEFPALVMISDQLEESAYNEVIIHETAHQWWQKTVGNNEIEHSFLDEGLAEYSVVLFYENYEEYSLSREVLVESSQKTYKIFCSVYDKLFGNVNTVMNRGLNEFSSEYEYVNIAYVKPTIMFDNLRTTIGDEKFFRALRNYYSDYKFENATPDDMVAEFEREVKDTTGYFYSFFEGKAII